MIKRTLKAWQNGDKDAAKEIDFMKIRILPIAFALVALLAGLATGCAQSQGANEGAGAGDTIGIVGAMDAEVDSLKAAMDVKNTTTCAGMEFFEGTLHGKRVVVVRCGMGKVNAGICTDTLVDDFGCTQVINAGVAGSLDARMDIGDFVVSTDAVQHDFDVEAIGFAKGEIPYTGLYAFPADENLRAAAVQAIHDTSPSAGVFEGRVCSGDQFISTQEQKDAITSAFGGLCCEMEGAAVAQTCYLNDVPFVVVRIVSDKPGETRTEDYKTFEAEAAQQCAAIIERMVESWN